MIISFMYVLLAILGLSFLIFIHELGHYLMARHVGMRVETFSIGFGKPIFTWMHDGVQWQVCWLLFGGYVKIAGVELSNKDQNPYEIPDGFFGKRPLDRIKVAFMGPLTNIVFALLAFSFLWIAGGREKNFSEHTKVIGWVDPSSELYKDGVRPGDKISAYNDSSFVDARDHIYAPMTSGSPILVRGYNIDYKTNQKTPFDYSVSLYQHPGALEKGIKTAGILQPASYIFYKRFSNGAENPLPPGSPLAESGIEYNDRIVWVNGELLFSMAQLNNLLEGSTALLTVKRDAQTILVRVPRVQVQELRADPFFKEELIDWQFEAKLNVEKIQNLYTIPYNINNNAVVENSLRFIDNDKQDKAFPSHALAEVEQTLQPGDRIIAINGAPIQYAYELLKHLQTFQVNIIVQRDSKLSAPIDWQNADTAFEQEVHWSDLEKIIASIGTQTPIKQQGDYYLLSVITPKSISEFALSAEKQDLFDIARAEQLKQINAIEDPDRRQHALVLFEKEQKRLLLGLPVTQDLQVKYNPLPTSLFATVFQEIRRTLAGLFSGALNPKWIVGPIGIVQLVHDNSMSSIKEALYWLGAISLNLGILNLLPIPVLDGGTILLSFLEMVTGKRMHPKTLEKLVIPFALLLIGFFIFLTYNDVLRLFTGIWH